MDELIYDEICNIRDLMMPGKGRIEARKVRHEYVVFVNHAAVSRFFACAVMMLARDVDSVRVHIVLEGEGAAEFINTYGPDREKLPDRIRITDISEEFPRDLIYEKTRVCTFLDASDGIYESLENQRKYLEELNRILEYARCFPTAKLVHTTVLPPIRPLPGTMAGISEREYECCCSGLSEDSPEQFVLRCDEELRTAARLGLKAVVSVMQNVYGPGVSNAVTDGLKGELLESGSISSDTRLHNHWFGMNYIRFAAAQVHYMFVHGAGGNIYHLQQFRTNPYSLATGVYPYLAPENISLNCTSSPPGEPEYALLCCKKAEKLQKSKYAGGSLSETLYRTLISGTDFSYRSNRDIFRYDGKLDEIKRLQLEMMREVKRICEKHDIRYFLVGGSLLGAVRHQGFIPWDDDLDIGMLREDFDRFARIAPGELDGKYAYQSHRTEKNCHYIFDKIRLRDTLFSTRFSDRFEMENGVFLDILVYDKTAKREAAQRRHIRALCLWSRAINVRWVNKPRKGIAYKLSRLLLPVMRLVPWGVYHGIFEAILKCFRRGSSRWLIDGVGQNIRKGAFPAEWFDETVLVTFENLVLPIPKGYDAYLRHWYGPDYMQLPPLSKRNSGHALKRIDLGPHAARFGMKAGKKRRISKQGELLDETKGDSLL